jgi:hypothetical protein
MENKTPRALKVRMDCVIVRVGLSVYNQNAPDSDRSRAKRVLAARL